MLQSVATGSLQTASGFEMRARSAAPASTASSALVNPATDSTNTSGSADAAPATVGELTSQEQQQVMQLQQTDRLVRAHEQAHLSVGADLVRGGPSFSYQTGPDHQRYAVAGEVSIDVSAASTPQETIPKAQHIRATALAPADPSAQDNSVAAQASRLESLARMEIAAAAATRTDPGNVRFYRGAEDGGGLGRRLDLFA